MAKDTELEEPEGLPEAPEGHVGEVENKVASGPLSVQFPPDMRVWNEARRLAADKNIRVEDLAVCALQDPVLVIDLLRVSNAMFFSGGRSPITSAKTAIVRLGSDVVIETLEKMRDRVPLVEERSRHWLEVHRSRCRRTAIVARILGEALARTLADDCQAAALMAHVGEMVAVAHFGPTYSKLADAHSSSAVTFRLAQDHKFDVEKMGLAYLRRAGIPEALLFAIDREARSRAADRAVMKPLCMASAELVDAFDNNRWEKFAPGKTFAPKSAVRMLQINDNTWLKLYERASEYLFAAKLVEEKNRKLATSGTPDDWKSAIDDSPPAPAEPEMSAEAISLESEVQSLIQPEPPPPSRPVRLAPPVREQYDELEESDAAEADKAPPPPRPRPVSPPVFDPNDSFSLSASREKLKKARVERSKTKEVPTPSPVLRTAKGTQMLSSISSMLGSAQNSEELLSQLLQKLIDEGPFEKSALIVVSKDRKNAVVVAARGPNIGNGQRLALDDPLSPIAQCFSKVQSFGNRSNENSPFGSKSFALAPIDADHQTPVVLYADCGIDGSLTFEARRIFRNVVELLNEKLPSIPGGIPVEVK